jgi:hypothetical protein
LGLKGTTPDSVLFNPAIILLQRPALLRVWKNAADFVRTIKNGGAN